jgi:hypothetical protein
MRGDYMPAESLQTQVQPPVVDISFAGWLKISAPSLVAMAFGFSLLWSGQQTLNTNVLQMQQAMGSQRVEVNRTVGRLEEAIIRIDGTLERLDATVGRLQETVETLSERVDRLES